MRIAIAQLDVKQNDFAENLKNANAFASRAKSAKAELVQFPEMFLTGFHYGENKKALAGGMNFERALCDIARDNKICVAGSVPAIDFGMDKPANRMLLVNENGEILSKYDKIHLFGVFNENRHVKGGDEIVVSNSPFGKIGLAVCYDLRFPEMFVQMTLKGAQIILVSAAWPHPRVEHFKIFCKARALECQCFISCVNQAGTEFFGPSAINYGGASCVVNPWGELIAECAPDIEDLQFADIDIAQVEDVRLKIPAIKDRRADCYK